jgi:hydrogenase maturation protease
VKNCKLVIGLGNSLVASDRVGCDVVEELQKDERFRGNVDFLLGGTDLLRHADALRGRELIVLVDAVTGADKNVTVREHGAPDLSEMQFSAHHLSAVQALTLLRWNDPEIAKARAVWVLVSNQLPNS